MAMSSMVLTVFIWFDAGGRRRQIRGAERRTYRFETARATWVERNWAEEHDKRTHRHQRKHHWQPGERAEVKLEQVTHCAPNIRCVVH